MDIVELLKRDIQAEDFFFNSYSGANERENLRKIVNEFLGCKDERHRETLSVIITNYVLLPHAKGAEIAPLMDILNMFELFENYEYDKNRKHMVHQLNTFLVGLLLYKNVGKLRKLIDQEMRNTTDCYSSGDPKGEFLFRWRLCSLCHDLGNGISLFGNDKEKIDKYLFYLRLLTNEEWDSEAEGIEKLLPLDRRLNSLGVLASVGKDPRLTVFFEELKENPYKNIYYDHGIASALILLKVLDQIYEKLDGKTVYYKGHNVSFNRIYFDKSIAGSAYAIAVHNVDFYPELYERIWGKGKIFDVRKHPLVFLLKLSDLLQEWYKPKAADESDSVEPRDIELDFRPGRIRVVRYPKKEELAEKISRFFNHENMIEIM